MEDVLTELGLEGNQIFASWRRRGTEIEATALQGEEKRSLQSTGWRAAGVPAVGW